MGDINQRDLMPIFLGALATSIEPVLTNRQKVEAAIKELGKDMSGVPESFRDTIRFAFNKTGKRVEQIFARLNYHHGLTWTYQGQDHLFKMDPSLAEQVLFDYAERQEERMFLKRFLEMIRIGTTNQEMNRHLPESLGKLYGFINCNLWRNFLFKQKFVDSNPQNNQVN